MPREAHLQRLFSTFPGGRPGAGLLLLRVALGGTLFAQGGAYLTDFHNLTVATGTVALLELVGGASLLIGYMTPIASVIGGVTTVGVALSWLPPPGSDLMTARLAIILAVAIAMSIICLGPGAFSLDARLFGRREIIIPDVSHSPRA